MPFEITLNPEVKRLLVLTGAVFLVAPLFPFLYLVTRWRERTPGGGTYAGVLYFGSASILIVLAATANLVYGGISTTPIDPLTTRVSWGMLWGGLLFFAIHAGLHAALRPVPELAPVRRVFGGFLMVMTGLVAFGALIALFTAVAADIDPALKAKAPGLPTPAEQRTDDIKLWSTWTAVFLAAYVATVIRLRTVLRTVPRTTSA